MVTPRGDGARVRAPAEVIDLLLRCRTFRDLPDHARALCAELGLPASARTELGALLARAAREGVLIAERELLAGLARQPPRAPARIETVAVATLDRPASLGQALESLAANATSHGRALDLVVFDDAASAAAAGRSREAARRAARRTGIAIGYAGPQQKARYARRLARFGLAPDLVAFALFPEERYAGANRNAMLLHAAGAAFASFDDDVVCRLWQPPAPRRALHVSSGDPLEVWTVAAGRRVEHDVLALHERYLGLGAGDCVRAAPRVRLGELPARLLGGFEAGEARVRVTSLGLRGDLGMGDGAPMYLLRIGGPSRERLREPRAYAAIARRFQALRCAPGPTLADAASYVFMTPACAYDHRELLPPFFPVRRGDDPLFGHELWACAPGALVAHLPCAVEHRRPLADRRRAVRESAARVCVGARYLPMYLVLVLCVQLLDEDLGGDPPARLRALGDHLVELAALPPRQLATVLGCAWAEVLLAHHLILRQRLDESVGAPEAMRRDLARYAEYFGNHGVAPEPTDVEDVARRLGTTPAAAGQWLIGRFGRLLRVWPDVFDAARELRRRGHGLVEPA